MTPAEAFATLAAEHLETPGGGRRRMFGCDCLSVDGRLVAFFRDDAMAFRLPAAEVAALLACGEGTTPTMGSRSMDGWVAVALAGTDGHARWRELLARACAR